MAQGDAQSVKDAQAAKIAGSRGEVIRQLALQGNDNPTDEEVDAGVAAANDPALHAQALDEGEATRQLALAGVEFPTEEQVARATILQHDAAFQAQSKAVLDATRQLAELGNESPSWGQVQRAVELMRDDEWQQRVNDFLDRRHQAENLGIPDADNESTARTISDLVPLLEPDGGKPFNTADALVDAVNGGDPFEVSSLKPGWTSPGTVPTTAGVGASTTGSGTSTVTSSTSGTSGGEHQSGEPVGAGRHEYGNDTKPDTGGADDPVAGTKTDRSWDSHTPATEGGHGDTAVDTTAHTEEYKNSDGTYTYVTTTTTTNTETGETETSTATETTDTQKQHVSDDGYSSTGTIPDTAGGHDRVETAYDGSSGHTDANVSVESGTIVGNEIHDQSGNPHAVAGDYGDPHAADAAPPPAAEDAHPPSNDPLIHVDPEQSIDADALAVQPQHAVHGGDFVNPTDPLFGNDNSVLPGANPHDTSPYEHDAGDVALGDDGLD